VELEECLCGEVKCGFKLSPCQTYFSSCKAGVERAQ
jgi:hypothetical protein